MKNKIVIEDEIEFPSVEFQNGRVVDYIEVYFGKDGMEENHFLRIAADEFKAWAREECDFSVAAMFKAEHRQILRFNLKRYISEEIFGTNDTYKLEREIERLKYELATKDNVRKLI